MHRAARRRRPVAAVRRRDGRAVHVPAAVRSDARPPVGFLTLVAVTTKFTVEVEEDVAVRVAAAASERGVAPEALAAEVLAEQFGHQRSLGFVSLGRSSSGRRASEDEDLLAEGFGL